MDTSIAIVRPPAVTLGDCELTHLERQPIDVGKAVEEHRDYCRLLVEHGYQVVALEADPRFPDGVFVEDAAVVLDEAAIICRPGARSRRGETADVARALEPYRALLHVEAPATVDGGDVLAHGKRIFVGRGSRTNCKGVDALRGLVTPHGYDVVAVPVDGALHLKTAVTSLNHETVILNPEWIDRNAFAAYRMIDVDPDEPFAANVLRLGDHVIMNASCPRTIDRVRSRGYEVIPHAFPELAKAESGLTCSSLLCEARR